MKRYAILSILLLALFVRLYQIGSPTIGVHQWRQSQTAMIAKNFYENGFKLAYPQIDWAGATPGFAETDFPIYSYVIAIAYKVVGVNDSTGRIVSIFFSLCTILFMYLLVKKEVDEDTALWSALFLAILPLFAFYGRAVMPESMMLASTVAGAYFFSRWLDEDTILFYLLSILFIATSTLLKPTSLYIGLPFLYLSLNRYGRAALVKPMIWIYVLLVFSATIVWYYHAHNLFLETGQTIGLYDKWLNFDILLTFKFWNRIIAQSLFERHFAFVGLVILLIGLFLRRMSERERLFDYWLAAVVIYILIATKGNEAHDYYQLPFVIPASVFIGKVYARYFVVDRFKYDKKALLLTLALIALIGLSGVRYFRYMSNEDLKASPTWAASQYIKENTAKDDLIVAVADGDPSILYLSDRKGFVATASQITEDFIDERVANGAQYITGVLWRFNEDGEKEKLKLLEDSGKYQSIYKDKVFFVLKAKTRNETSSNTSK